MVPLFQAQPIGQTNLILPFIDHGGHEIVGDRIGRDDPRQRARPLQAQPGRQPGISQRAAKRRITADQFDLVEQHAPPGVTGGVQQRCQELDPLLHQGTDQRATEVEFGRATAARTSVPAARPQARIFASRQEPFDLARGAGPAACRAATGTAARKTSARGASPACSHGGFQRRHLIARLPQDGQRPGDRVVMTVRQRRRAHGRLEHTPRIGERRFLTDHDAADDEVLRARDLGQVAKKMRLAGARSSRDTQSWASSRNSPDVLEHLVEFVFQAGVSSVPIRRTAARFGTPARATPRSRCVLRGSQAHHHQGRQRILPVPGPHIGPDSHLQSLVSVEGPPAVADDEALIREVE